MPNEIRLAVEKKRGISLHPEELDALLHELREKYTVMLDQIEELRLSLTMTLPHELRTPLNAILGFSQYLISLDSHTLPEPEKMLQMHAAIYQNARRLEHLVENYLLYAKLRMTAQDAELNSLSEWQATRSIEPSRLFSEIALHKAEDMQRRPDLHVALAEGNMQASEKSLRKILDELLDNAQLHLDSLGTDMAENVEVVKDNSGETQLTFIESIPDPIKQKLHQSFHKLLPE